MNIPKHTVSRLAVAAAVAFFFFLLSAFYFAPQYRGEVLPQHDIIQYQGMAKDLLQTRADSGVDPQWTGRMFGGMPAYLINIAYPAQIVKGSVGKVIALVATPAGFLFFAMLAMWTMLAMMGIDRRVAIVPALAYGFSTYFLLIIGAGHITKMWALVYAPLMMGGVWMTLRRDRWLGAALTALFASLEIGANHPQITYYFLLAMAALWINDLICRWRSGQLRDFFLRTALLLAAGTLAVGSNFSPLWYTMQHTKETMRGGSELAEPDTPARKGLDLEYATAWSYGIDESWNLLVPDFMGGDSATPFSPDGQVARALEPYGMQGIARQLPRYWGDQPFTAGPTYLGAVAVLLAALGIGLARGRNKWWLIAVSALMMMLAWGSHLMGFTRLMFDLLPGYNKFRTVSMALTVVQWSVPLLGAYALMRLWRNELDKRRILKVLAWATGITGGACLLLAVAGSAIYDFGREQDLRSLTQEYGRMMSDAGMDEAVAGGMHEELALVTSDAMSRERAAVMRKDAWRSLLFILLAAATIALFAWGRIKGWAMLAALGVLVLADLVPVDLRYLPQSRFVPARRQKIQPTDADRAILQDKEPGFRVLNLTVSPFNDATTSYFHRSVGGYHGAKLARYQDLIDRYLTPLDRIDEQVLDMLNTRYLIVPGAGGVPQAMRRGTEFGAAWFVDRIATADSPRREIELLGETDLRSTAIVAEQDLRLLEELPLRSDSARRIALVEYLPHYLKYEYTAPEASVAVFSEIFYDQGWRAYVDGVESPVLRADYVLRAMALPAGSHTVEWRFRAPGWNTAEGITLAASLLIVLGLPAAIVCRLRKKED